MWGFLAFIKHSLGEWKILKRFSPYYQPLIPWVNRLRKIVFPGGRRRKGKDKKLPS
ncbi:hypothetical protein AOQ84DRAFT_71750 [Glonium stellatum]|uniref:Uncharacterized protein n=1 Tax=Glonium stellatum TaxID=574774 RepID=A0A8E2EXK2_9PEZI|nr:hypothetical protein AOQ84DRAFT_71750 [Glonium stellatum]